MASLWTSMCSSIVGEWVLGIIAMSAFDQLVALCSLLTLSTGLFQLGKKVKKETSTWVHETKNFISHSVEKMEAKITEAKDKMVTEMSSLAIKMINSDVVDYIKWPFKMITEYWGLMFCAIAGTLMITSRYYQYKAAKKMSKKGVKPEAISGTFSKIGFFAIVDTLATIVMIVGGLRFGFVESTKVYGSVKTVLSALFGKRNVFGENRAPGTEQKDDPFSGHADAHGDLISMVETIDSEGKLKEDPELGNKRIKIGIFFFMAVTISAGLIALIWHFNGKPKVKKIIKKLGNDKYRKPTKQMKKENTWTTASSIDLDEINEDWVMVMYHPGKRAFIEVEYNTPEYDEAYDALVEDGLDPEETIFAIDAWGKRRRINFREDQEDEDDDHGGHKESEKKQKTCAQCKQPAWKKSNLCPTHIKQAALTLEKPKTKVECVHVNNCPTKTKTSSGELCGVACGGHNCTHWAGCTPKTEALKVEKPKKEVTFTKTQCKVCKKQVDASDHYLKKNDKIIKKYGYKCQECIKDKSQLKKEGEEPVRASQVNKPEALLGKVRHEGRFYPFVSRLETATDKGHGFQFGNLIWSVQHVTKGQSGEMENQLMKAQFEPGVGNAEQDWSISRLPKTTAMGIQPPVRQSEPGEAIMMLTRNEAGTVVSNYGRTIKVGDELVSHDIPAVEGCSGAPIFATKDGALVGLHIGTDSKKKPTDNYFVPALLLQKEAGSLKAQ